VIDICYQSLFFSHFPTIINGDDVKIILPLMVLAPRLRLYKIFSYKRHMYILFLKIFYFTCFTDFVNLQIQNLFPFTRARKKHQTRSNLIKIKLVFIIDIRRNIFFMKLNQLIQIDTKRSINNNNVTNLYTIFTVKKNLYTF
jgi:hypothetical protein